MFRTIVRKALKARDTIEDDVLQYWSREDMMVIRQSAEYDSAEEQGKSDTGWTLWLGGDARKIPLLAHNKLDHHSSLSFPDSIHRKKLCLWAS